MKRYRVDFFDGTSSKKISLTLEVSEEFISFLEVDWQFVVEEVQLSSKLEGVSQTLTLPNGGYCVLKSDDTLSFNKSIVPFLESKLKYALMSLVLIVGVVGILLTVGSSWSAKVVASMLPQSVSKELGKQSFAFLEQNYLQPSRLSSKTKEDLAKIFYKIAPDGLHVKLHFYSSTLLGANAFALPSGDIVLLDGLVELDKNEELLGIVGVLAHEIGHVKQKHTLQSIVKGSIIGILMAYFIGDYSTVITVLSTGLLTFSYSREFEREADDEAIKIMNKNNYSLKPLANLFETISQHMAFKQKEIFSTHPLFRERVEKIRTHVK